MKEADMLAIKMDLLLKRLDKRAIDKEAMKSTVQAMDSRMTCEVCEKSDIEGTTTLRPMKMQPISTTGFDKVIITGGTISLARKEVIRTLTQIIIRINLP